MTRIGNAYRAMENYGEAIDWYKKSLTEHRNAATLKSLNETKKLKKKADADAYLNPEKALEAKEAGNVAFKAGDYPLAVKHYTEAIKRDPTQHVFYSNRAGAYTMVGGALARSWET